MGDVFQFPSRDDNVIYAFCPNCASTNFKLRLKYPSDIRAFEAFVCSHCEFFISLVEEEAE